MRVDAADAAPARRPQQATVLLTGLGAGLLAGWAVLLLTLPVQAGQNEEILAGVRLRERRHSQNGLSLGGANRRPAVNGVAC